MTDSSDMSLKRAMAIERTTNLVDLLEEARERLRAAAVDAVVFRIPTRGIDDEIAPTGPVTHDSGSAAIDAALAVLCRTEYNDGQHPLSTLRWPGILRIDSDLSDLMTRVNLAKNELAEAMRRISESQWRISRGQVGCWMRLNRLQAYRNWRWFDIPPAKINFTWAGHTRGGEQLRIGALIERLTRDLRHGGHGRIEAELDYLAGFDPNEIVVIRRPVAPTPIANVVFSDKRRRMFKPTTLPLLTTGPMPTVKPLQALSTDERSQERDDQVIGRPLIRAWHVWRYLPQVRFALEQDPVTVRVAAPSLKPCQFVMRTGSTRHWRRCDKALDRLREYIDHRGAITPSLPIDDASSLSVVAASRTNFYIEDAVEDAIWRAPKKQLAKALVNGFE